MSIKNPLSWAHPLVQEWFLEHLGYPTEPQIKGWPAILEGKSILISAPTGSGKTLAAFLICINELVTQAVTGVLQDKTEVLYISPLKALSNDIQKNLTIPLEEITKKASKKGLKLDAIQIAVRTGDTLTHERQAMVKKNPHILVTTPESLYILLTAEKSRAMLRNVKTVIVDEIHALVNNKRGAHLALSLERLQSLTNNNLLRIGLSATQKPLNEVANFLQGNHNNPVKIVDIGHARHIEINIEVPSSELGPVASNELWDEIYDRVSDLSKNNRSTLVFVNTRRLAERVAHHLSERLGENTVAAHHGSLSRKLRLEAETRLKNGELKVLVATASLELGIDIGVIDLVCQIGSPRSIAIALQRIGRAGHWHGAISKGRIFPTTLNELVECASLVNAIKEEDLDKIIMPYQPLDILAQQIIAICATGEWQEQELFDLVRNAYPYKNLTVEVFTEILTMLSEGIAGSRGRYGTYLIRDQVNNKVKGRRGSRLISITSGGAIPDNGLFTMVSEPTETMVGTLDEDFAVESNRGDIILLGTTSWMIKRVESSKGRVLVEDAHGAPPSVPFWRGEAPARTNELSKHVSMLRQRISDMVPSSNSDPGNAKSWLIKNCGLNDSGAEQIIEYILKGRAILGAVPTQACIIAERFFDESGGMQLIIHSPFGARINKAWGLALRKRFCRSFNFELQAAATDDGINISLAEQHSFPLLDVFKFLHPNTILDVLTQAVLQSPLFTTRWRWTATRSLAIVRFRNGKKVPPNISRMLSDDLLAAVFPDAAACQDNLAGQDVILPNHPLTNETMKDALHEALDSEGLKNLLENIINGNIKTLAVDTPIPSIFSHEILNANPYAFLDDAPLEERRARAVEMRRILPECVLNEIGLLDPLAIEEVKKQAWPDIRDADEFHGLLQSIIMIPITYVEWEIYFNELLKSGRAGIATVNQHKYWVAAETANVFKIIYPSATFETQLKNIPGKNFSREEAIEKLIQGWIFILGPCDSILLQKIFNIDSNDIQQGLLKLESTGLILRGNFTNNNSIEWCERRLLARIHRLTIGSLRSEIQPVTPAQFMQWLLSWQHLAYQTQLSGKLGLLEIIKQLQGFEIPANAWENKILKKRIKDYSKEILDHLCLTGVIGWGRLSTRINKNKGYTLPTSVAPITFFLRENIDWMSNSANFTADNFNLMNSTAKKIYDYLAKRGASFFTDIVKGVGALKAEVETGLWELVALGAVTSDSFDNLRGLIDPRRRLGKKGRRNLPRFAQGRWSLLHYEISQAPEKRLESICWLLLKRYGVVFRDLLKREKIIPTWRELLIIFRKLEARGEIRGGRFVNGFLGEQFALPYAVDSLRAMKKKEFNDEKCEISSADPLNLVGIILPGEKISSLSDKSIILQNGIFIED